MTRKSLMFGLIVTALLTTGCGGKAPQSAQGKESVQKVPAAAPAHKEVTAPAPANASQEQIPSRPKASIADQIPPTKPTKADAIPPVASGALSEPPQAPLKVEPCTPLKPIYDANKFIAIELKDTDGSISSFSVYVNQDDPQKRGICKELISKSYVPRTILSRNEVHVLWDNADFHILAKSLKILQICFVVEEEDGNLDIVKSTIIDLPEIVGQTSISEDALRNPLNNLSLNAKDCSLKAASRYQLLFNLWKRYHSCSQKGFYRNH